MMDNRKDTITEATWKDLYEIERKRLAMLWKAFQDAEARIGELEGKLNDISEAPVAKAAATTATVPEIVEVVRPTSQLVAVHAMGATEVVSDELAPQPRFPVKLKKAEDLPGIKKTEVEKLRTYGVNVTDEMLHADLGKLSDATGIPRARMQRFRDLSELISVKGIGPQWAERLVDASVNDIRTLATFTPEELTQTLLRSYEKERISEKRLLVLQRTLPARAGALISAAKRDARVLGAAAVEPAN